MRSGDVTIRSCTKAEAAPFIERVHYARRWPSVTWCFAYIRSGRILGVVTYGTPSSAPLRSGVCGDEYAPNVVELNRLCFVHRVPNGASMLVGRSLAMLPRPKVVISFADTAQGHVGYVYQATNWLYTGLSAKRTDWAVRGMEHLHGQTIADRFRGSEDRAAAIRAAYGDNFYLKPRPRKHRYITFVGDRRWVRAARKALSYAVEPYPKGNTQRAEHGMTLADVQSRQVSLFDWEA